MKIDLIIGAKILSFLEEIENDGYEAYMEKQRSEINKRIAAKKAKEHLNCSNAVKQVHASRLEAVTTRVCTQVGKAPAQT